MKLTLDDLKVDSYAVQVSETELAEVKGGTWSICYDIGVATASLLIAAYEAWNSGGSSGGSSGGTSGGTNWDFGTVSADSIVVTNSDGSTYRFYGVNQD